MLVSSEICISSTETIGGKSMGSLSINGKLKIVNKIIIEWNVKE